MRMLLSSRQPQLRPNDLVAVRAARDITPPLRPDLASFGDFALENRQNPRSRGGNHRMSGLNIQSAQYRAGHG